MDDTFDWYLGIDWGSQEHALCVIDRGGVVRGQRTVAHTAAAIHEAMQWVTGLTGAAPGAIAVGLERPDGVVVDTFGEHGFALFAINPKQLDRFRDRFTAAGAKDDRRDAHVVADSLRTDRRAFHRIVADAPARIQLRALTHLEADLQVQQLRLTNRLREQLYRVDAAWLEVCPAADEPWLWALLAKLPDPRQWPRIGVGRLTTIFRAHRIRRLQPADLAAALRHPRLTVAAGVPEAVALHLTALIPQLQLISAQRRETQRRIDQWLETCPTEETEGHPGAHRDVEILRSLPGVGRMVTATMLTEVAGPLAARDYPTLRRHAGTAPVTSRSGKARPFVRMRYACNGRVRQALHHWARISLQHDPPARAYYDVLRRRGHTHPRALRSVADRWLRILVAMLKTGTRYDVSRFTIAHSAA